MRGDAAPQHAHTVRVQPVSVGLAHSYSFPKERESGDRDTGSPEAQEAGWTCPCGNLNPLPSRTQETPTWAQGWEQAEPRCVRAYTRSLQSRPRCGTHRPGDRGRERRGQSQTRSQECRPPHCVPSTPETGEDKGKALTQAPSPRGFTETQSRGTEAVCVSPIQPHRCAHTQRTRARTHVHPRPAPGQGITCARKGPSSGPGCCPGIP